MSVEYEFTLHTPAGEPLKTLKVSVMDWARVENDIGAVKLTVSPKLYDYYEFHRDQILTVQRSVDGKRPYLKGERLWFLRGRRYEQENRALALTFNDNNVLLRRRLIAYEDGEPQADKSQAADDMLKAFVRENLGTLATDPTRNISAWLTVAADKTLGPVIDKTCAWAPLLQTLQEVAKLSENTGTYLAFDISCVRPPHNVPLTATPRFELAFETFIGQRGKDKRSPGGDPEILVGPDFKNLTDVAVEDDWTDESTHIYAGGEGQGLLRDIEEADEPYIGLLGPLGRIEGWHDDREIDSVIDLTDAAAAALQGALTRTRIRGTFHDMPQTRWDFDLGFGDLVTIQVKDRKADCRLSREHITWEREKGEVLEIIAEGLSTVAV